MPKPLWAPWRLEYIQRPDEDGGCFLCRAAGAAGTDTEAELLVVGRERRALALLNRFPYASGHLLVAPLRHIGDFTELDDGEALEIHRLAARSVEALGRVFSPQGYNIGWNLGRAAGAGIVDHVHLHVVPRWAGDTNFMPVLADVKVLPEHLLVTREKLAAAWPATDRREGAR